MKKLFLSSYMLPIFLSIFVSIFSVPFFFVSDENLSFSNNSIFSSYAWPTRGYTNITSKFGYRKAPTRGASTYHGGIDIAAPEGANISAISNGTVSYVGWYNATGYTIIISHENGITSTYGHVSENFIVSIGQNISKGQIIANVGPKYVSRSSQYKDQTGKYTNGATTGPHLHLAISKDGKRIDPLSVL